MSGNDKGNHPAYQHILDVLPESLHSVVIPELKKWDAGVTQKFQEIHASYEPLKPFQQFVDNNIDPQYAEQAVVLADQLQRDPAKVVAQVNESWKLGFVSPEQAAALQNNSNSGDDPEFDLNLEDDEDILKNPKVKAMYDTLQNIQGEWTSRKEQEEMEAEVAAFEEELDALEKKVTEGENPLPFNRLFVTAMMQQGLSGEDAVKQYHQALAISTQGDNTSEQAQQTNQNNSQPPVVMGSKGTAGSGTSTDVINFGELSKNQLNETIEQMLAQAAGSGQG